MLTLKSLFLTTVLLKLIQFGESYIITIDARAQDCFYEHGPKMSKLIVFFACKIFMFKFEFANLIPFC